MHFFFCYNVRRTCLYFLAFNHYDLIIALICLRSISDLVLKKSHEAYKKIIHLVFNVRTLFTLRSHLRLAFYHRSRFYMAELLPIRRETLHN